MRGYSTLAILNMLCTSLLPYLYPVSLQHSSYTHVISIRVENSVDPDQMASSKASSSGYKVFSKRGKFGFSRTTRVEYYGYPLPLYFNGLSFVLNKSYEFDISTV